MGNLPPDADPREVAVAVAFYAIILGVLVAVAWHVWTATR